MPDITLIIQQIVILAPPILLAVTIHEFAHGWVADKLGDDTARKAGRLTLNPIKHLDVVGTLVFFHNPKNRLGKAGADQSDEPA